MNISLNSVALCMANALLWFTTKSVFKWIISNNAPNNSNLMQSEKSLKITRWMIIFEIINKNYCTIIRFFILLTRCTCMINRIIIIIIIITIIIIIII